MREVGLVLFYTVAHEIQSPKNPMTPGAVCSTFLLWGSSGSCPPVDIAVCRGVFFPVRDAVERLLLEPEPGAQLHVLLGDDGVAKDPAADEVR